MATIGTTEAATVLADHFGARLEAGRDEGRRLMRDALHQHFGISKPDARRLVDALEHAGTIRWVMHRADTAPGAGALGSAPGAGAFGSIPVVGAVQTEGYWQLEPA